MAGNHNFKTSPVGQVPKDWDVRTIDSIAVVTTGSQNTQDNVQNGQYPFYVRSQQVERINKWIFDTEGVVTAGDGVGTGKVFHYVNGKFGLHQRCYLIHDFVPEVNARFFYWLFSKFFYDRVHSMTAKSSVDSVRREMIADMQVPIPPLTEQIKIATALSSIESLISQIGLLIEKKRRIQEGTMQLLMTGKSRLPGFEGAWNSNKMWELTAWDKFFSEVESYKQSKVVKYPYLLAADLAAMKQRSGDVRLLATGDFDGWTSVEKAGSFLCEGEVVSIPWGGYANIKYTKGRFVTADNRIATSLDVCRLNNKFLYYYMLVNQSVINTFYRGAGIQHPSMQDVLDMDILYPSIKEQDAIVQVLSAMEDEINALAAKQEKVILIKQGMMQELLTGKTRLI